MLAKTVTAKYVRTRQDILQVANLAVCYRRAANTPMKTTDIS